LGAILGFADNDLDDLAILSKVLLPSQCLKKILLSNAWVQTNDVDQILLYHSQARKMLSI
jgi:hypothetical protein